MSLIAHNGICLPATCSAEENIKFVNVFLYKVGLAAVGARCQTKDPLPFDSVDIAAM